MFFHMSFFFMVQTPFIEKPAVSAGHEEESDLGGRDDHEDHGGGRTQSPRPLGEAPHPQVGHADHLPKLDTFFSDRAARVRAWGSPCSRYNSSSGTGTDEV